jgi:hypothetical protein
VSDYRLASDVESERLELQARVWEPDAAAVLDEIGVASGWSCVDLGCGARGILGPLARRVGARGRVVGVDRDHALLGAAAAYVAREGFGNVELLEGDVRSSSLMHGALRARMLEARLTTEAELDELVHAVAACASDPDRMQITFTVVQLWGRKAGLP